VMGHDSAAAAVMGQVRSSLRALLIDRPQAPHEVLTRLDRVMIAGAGADRLSAAVLATLTPCASGAEVEWSNAGHLPPLVLAPGAAPEFLGAEPDRLLGIDGGEAPRRSHRRVLPVGATLMLYTDGLVERRGIDLDESLAGLAMMADSAKSLDLPDMLDAIVAAALSSGHDDDTAVFALRVL
jgi:serine phosphatase RsbU (regulator of sigma subunit)